MGSLGRFTIPCILGSVVFAATLSGDPVVELSAEFPGTGRELKCRAPISTYSPDATTRESSCNCSSVEKFMSKDKKCETTVKTFMSETKRNSSSVDESEDGVKTTVTHETFTTKYIASNTVSV
ncbi:hypothetical protein Y032_0032g2501 [Ancylostoma ceylanicum]|uniref:Uncharacterized protein n=1 Tax=Ancylostoma ceylanicum TaxID=53326 RepID=A0A016UN24_9BILA|nr:hypothetical protein Y032_0032g2501 [Ancylostoma ceylanicum]